MRRRTNNCVPICLWAILLLVEVGSNAIAADPQTPGLKVLRTPEEIGFAILGAKPAKPAPTLFVFATDAVTTLSSDHYLAAGRLLSPQGYLCVSLDLPCHGAERRAGEPDGLAGWRHRINAGQNPMEDLTERCRKVLDYLVQAGYTDPKQVAACGTSRGGFSALHVAAADERIRAVAGYAPVTDLKALSEFKGAEDLPLVRKLALAMSADKLAARGVWIVIGDRDERVDTDMAIGLARAISAAAAKQSAPGRVELHVLPAKGHTTPAGSAEQSAAWIARTLGGEK